MPRGGRHDADGYSPFKANNGRELRRLKSSKSTTGYLNVVNIRGKFWAKKKLDDVPGSKKMKLFGGGKDEAWQAANQLAEYLDSPYELPEAPPRKVSRRHHTTQHMHCGSRPCSLRPQLMDATESRFRSRPSRSSRSGTR